jgi:outer membrane protein with beta-barrel domain
MSIQSVLGAVFAAAVLLILPASTFAQQVGVKAGINFASLPPEEDENPDIPPRIGPVGGVWFRIVPTNRLSFQAEALFSEKGVHWNFSPNVKIEIRIRYVEIPLLTRADFSAATATTRLYVVGGVAPAFKLSARAKTEFQGETGTQDVGREIERFDLGLIGGVGVEFGRALIEARYTHGLLRINTDDNNPEDRLNNRVFSVTMGFRLR